MFKNHWARKQEYNDNYYDLHEDWIQGNYQLGIMEYLGIRTDKGRITTLALSIRQRRGIFGLGASGWHSIQRSFHVTEEIKDVRAALCLLRTKCLDRGLGNTWRLVVDRVINEAKEDLQKIKEKHCLDDLSRGIFTYQERCNISRLQKIINEGYLK